MVPAEALDIEGGVPGFADGGGGVSQQAGQLRMAIGLRHYAPAVMRSPGIVRSLIISALAHRADGFRGFGVPGRGKPSEAASSGVFVRALRTTSAIAALTSAGSLLWM
jgi:hypothetical protein